MLDELLNQLEKKFKTNNTLSEEQQSEFLNLTNKLREELTDLAKNEPDKAHSIAGFTNMTAHESLKSEKNESLLEHSSKGLSQSIQEFEISHPNLVGIIDTISRTLSRLGV